MASIVAFDDIWWALLVPIVFLAIDTVHGNIVLPLLLGKRFTLDPAVLFVGLFFWWFVWGTAGALLAVPMISALRIFCDHVDGFQRFGRILGGAEETEPSSAESPAPVA
jgi:predicted PurR-regulated permease PerM